VITAKPVASPGLVSTLVMWVEKRATKVKAINNKVPHPKLQPLDWARDGLGSCMEIILAPQLTASRAPRQGGIEVGIHRKDS
jgi:selenophosphate synthetase-related protein